MITFVVFTWTPVNISNTRILYKSSLGYEIKFSQSVMREIHTSATSERDCHFVSEETNILIPCGSGSTI